MRTVSKAELTQSEQTKSGVSDAQEARGNQPRGSVDAGKTASDRVRSSTRRVMQGAILGGYWLYSGGRPIFVRTVGKGVRSGKQKNSRNLDKLPQAPSPDQTINSVPRKPKKSVEKPKPRTATKIARVDRKKSVRIQG